MSNFAFIDNYRRFIEKEHLNKFIKANPNIEILVNHWLNYYHVIIGFNNKDKEMTAKFSLANYNSNKFRQEYPINIYPHKNDAGFYYYYFQGQSIKQLPTAIKEIILRRGITRASKTGNTIYDRGLHRLCAGIYWGNIKNLEIHHQNGNKFDNNIDNLFPISNELHGILKNRKAERLTIREIKNIRDNFAKKSKKEKKSKNRTDSILYRFLYLKHIKNYQSKDIEKKLNIPDTTLIRWEKDFLNFKQFYENCEDRDASFKLKVLSSTTEPYIEKLAS